MGSTSARIALTNTASALSGACPSGGSIIDLVGYGNSATCFEGAGPTATLSNATAATRKRDGCLDTDNNSSDFFADGPIPRNSSWPVQSCGGDPTRLFAFGIARPASVDPAATTVLTVTVTPATNSPSTGITVQVNLSAIGGSALQQFYDDGTHGDVTAGDNVFSFTTSAVVGTATGSKSLLATVTDAQSRSFTGPITMTVQSPTCGVERWSVKTGTDPDAGLVDLNSPTPTTILDMRGWATPGVVPDNSRIAPYETTLWVVDATLTLYKLEDDVDYHIVVRDDSGNTIVTEIPLPGCVGPSSPFGSMVANARAEFDAHLTATTSFKSANLPVHVTGVGMFDFIHGQTGVAPNGIELHPVVDIIFKSTSTASVTSVSNSSQFGQPVTFTASIVSADAPIPTGTVTFKDGANVIGMGNLDNLGNATFQTSSLSIGSHSITAVYGGDSHTVGSTSLVYNQGITKADQTISFDQLGDKVFGDPDFSVSATASSGLPVTFGATGFCTVSGSTVHISGVGTCTITASQGGDGNYNPAADQARTFNIAKTSQSITFGVLANKTYGDPDFSVSATSSSGLVVSFTATGDCSVVGDLVHIAGAGSCTITAYQAGDANYDPAPMVLRSFSIAQAASVTSITCSDVPYTSVARTPCSASVTGFGGLNQSLSVTYSNNANAGAASGSAEFTGDANHLGSTDSANFQITPAALTITAANKSKIFGSAVTFDTTTPSTDFTVATLLGSDTVTSVTLTSAGADGSAPAGSYPILIGAAAGSGLGNYTITYVNGTLTVGGYFFNGFNNPIENTTTNVIVWNKASAGQTIAAKWRLTLNGIPVSALTSFVTLQSFEANCNSGTSIDTDNIPDEGVPPGGADLTYQGDGNFQFNWKTPKSYNNQCRIMWALLLDGSKSPLTYFKFK